VNRAITILYARQLLVELCAHWPKVTADQPMTVLAALGCSDVQYLPFVLDLLYTDQLKSKLQPVCLLSHFSCIKFVLHLSSLVEVLWLHPIIVQAPQTCPLWQLLSRHPHF